ncbi:uncharacterized protein LOC131637289 [Vicia villosa]|uniref:uncharacterized protein LOC131637289 n=1 Tax=Vicia villosa TaxID=3911 RepID=UPI00273A9C87|nr:uncharacterized protein LOC131637289 [Vicia villosa]
MEQLEQNQASLREEVNQLKGSVEEIKGGMTQMLSFMKDFMEKQEKVKETSNKETCEQYDDLPDDGNPLLGYIPGFGPSKNVHSQQGTHARSSKKVIQSHEEGETSQEGFIPPPQKEGTSRIVRIPSNNPPKEDDYLDLQYGYQEGDNTTRIPQPKQSSHNVMEDSKDNNQIKALEERLKAVEGYDTFEVGALEMCLVPDVVIPPKFKVPDFEKYKGLTCPRNHLRMYCRKMAAYAHDQKLMIHTFQDSLSGASLDWYMQLEQNYIRTWDNLAHAFLKQYKYNLDMAPNRMQLQNLSQKKEESFKEYAQRWREIAARVQPPLLEKELVDMFMSTLQGIYYEKMVGSVSSGFSDLVMIGERIETGLKNGKIQGAPPSTSFSSKKPVPNFTKKREGETNAVASQLRAQQPWVIPQNQQQNKFQRLPRRFDPLPMPHGQLLQHLIRASLVELKPLAPPIGELPPNYDANVRCEYHANSPGHTLEKCWAFRHKVQDLIESQDITFEKPNIKTNPMPPHGGSNVNAIEVATDHEGTKRVKAPIDLLKEYLFEQGFLLEHNEAFEDTLQKLVDQKMVQFKYYTKEEYIATINVNTRKPLVIPCQGPMSTKKPLVIPYTDSNAAKAPLTIPTPSKSTLVIEEPYPTPYESDKTVPWSYDTTVYINGQKQEPAIINIAGTGGITRSGRVYAPDLQEKDKNPTKDKGKAIAEASQEPESSNKALLDKEKEEFLKMIKRSDYRVVDQLHQTQSKISILQLLLSSEAHRDSLMKILNAAHVAKEITVDQFDGVVANLTSGARLGFDDSELPPQGRAHNKALHISIRCGSTSLSRVLTDTGSSLNVLPKTSLMKLTLEGIIIRPSSMVVKAFDGSQSTVFGEVDLPIKIGPHTFYITFQVMDIEPAYTCLLGRPWIHSAGAVTSTLHQKLKFLTEGKLVVIEGEEDIFVSHLESYRYIGVEEDCVETPFQVLEAAAVSTLPVEKIKKSGTPITSWRDLQTMVGNQAPEGWGKLIDIPEKKDRLGLGYKLSDTTKKNEERFPPIPSIFISKGIEHGGSVSVISDKGNIKGASNLIRECLPDEELKNWTIVEIPEIFFFPKSTPILIDNDTATIRYNFDAPINQAEEEDEEDYELTKELTRLIEQESKDTLPSHEAIEIINLGNEAEPKEIKIGATLEESVKQRLIKLLHEHKDIFAWSYRDMPGLDTDIVVHKLPLKEGCSPVRQKLRRTRPDMADKIREEVLKQFDAGFLAVADYPPWIANIVPVPKKGGKVRMCVDYRDLNKASPKDDFPLPHIDVLVDNTAQASVFSFMDEIEVYVDDMIAKSHTEEDHIVHLQKLFERLQKYKLRLNPNKCTFGVRSGKLLGFIVSQRGIEVDPDKVKAIQEMPAPKTEKEVRGFLGRLNYISRFISHLTATCEPIFKLLRKNQEIQWNEDCQTAFETIKQYLQEPPILMPPVHGRPLIMYLTVLERSMGCVLGQQDETGRKEHAIYYLSKKFTDCESRYSYLEKTCCALAWATKRLRQYMLTHTTWLIARMDPLKYVFEKPALTGRIARWQMLLSEYDIQYVTQKAIKGSVLADHLAHQPLTEYQSMKFDFPDEDIMVIKDCEAPGPNEGPELGARWTLMFDGASNALGHGVGAVLTSPENFHRPYTARLCFDCTNNVAEYEACILGLEAAVDLRIKFLDVYGDSALVIYQVKGEWDTKHPKLIPYRDHVLELAMQFTSITFFHIPREENQMADALATLSSMFKTAWPNHEPHITIRHFEEPAHCLAIEEGPDNKPWFYDIRRYLEKQEYPENASIIDKRTLRKLASKFFLNGDILYKRNYDLVLLRCVDKQEADALMKEIHEGTFGTHASGHTMARKILRAGYYWLTMETDCYHYTKTCHKCQIYADKMHVPPTPLNVMSSPWPFSMWGIDMIGMIEPKASNGHRFILVAIDYFTKWVEAASYANVTRQVVTRFIKHNIICRYGVPSRIITDNGSNLNNKMMKELCDEFKIEHHNSSPYRPKMNGAVEAANKNIKKIVQKMVKTYKDWHEMLPFALHGYRTTMRTSTGATPYSLVYGMEAVLPIEVEIPSLRVLAEVELEEAEWVQTRLDQLNLIEEKRLTALCHGQLYQKRMKKAFDKKVRPRTFQEGDLVLKKILLPRLDSRGKWTPNYEGPYVVKTALSGGALILTTMDGEELSHPLNSDAVKKYYV